MMKTKLILCAASLATALSGPAFGANAVIEIFASEETGTWTITVTSVHGMTCLVASGQAFETLAEVLPVDGDDA